MDTVAISETLKLESQVLLVLFGTAFILSLIPWKRLNKKFQQVIR